MKTTPPMNHCHLKIPCFHFYFVDATIVAWTACFWIHATRSCNTQKPPNFFHDFTNVHTAQMHLEGVGTLLMQRSLNYGFFCNLNPQNYQLLTPSEKCQNNHSTFHENCKKWAKSYWLDWPQAQAAFVKVNALFPQN